MASYGYLNTLKPPKAPKLAQAAASKDPYGLAPNNRSGPLGIGSSSGFAAPVATQHPAVTNPAPGAATIQKPGDRTVIPQQAPTPTAAAVNHYDLSTDPALQQIQALVGQSNEQAQASALKQRQDLLLAYGDPSLASAVLGADDPTAAAAGQNPTSTVAQLGQSRDRNLKTLDDQLNEANLGYSGYRVTQETQAGQDYQNALAQAAAGLNSNLDTVGGNLQAALAANNQTLAGGISAAGDRASQAAAANGTDPGAIDPNDPNALAGAAGGSDANAGTGAGTNGLSPEQLAAIIQAALARKQNALTLSGQGSE